MDLIGSVALYAQLHERLLPGYVLDAVAVRSRARTPPRGGGATFP